VANKIDLADGEAINLFHQLANHSQPEKALIAQTIQGQLDVTWLDIPRHPKRQASFPHAHKASKFYPSNNPDHPLNNKADGFQSFGHIFPAQSYFDYKQLNNFLNQFKTERIKGIVKTNKGWFIINGTGNKINYVSAPPSTNSRIEIITRQNCFQYISSAFNQIVRQTL